MQYPQLDFDRRCFVAGLDARALKNEANRRTTTPMVEFKRAGGDRIIAGLSDREVMMRSRRFDWKLCPNSKNDPYEPRMLSSRR